jgi:hypothetical protein
MECFCSCVLEQICQSVNYQKCQMRSCKQEIGSMKLYEMQQYLLKACNFAHKDQSCGQFKVETTTK